LSWIAPGFALASMTKKFPRTAHQFDETLFGRDERHGGIHSDHQAIFS
jgi:hypothetical protein